GEGAIGDAQPAPVPHAQGTTVEVRDLFFNTPARRKFMRAEGTEFRHADQLMRRLALSRFDVGFKLRHQNRNVFDCARASSDVERERRIATLCGEEFMESALYIEESRGDLKLSGWLALPSFSRAQPDLQNFYVNGRAVRDKLLGYAMRRAYADVLHSTR